MTAQDRAQVDYLRWLSVAEPTIYRKVIAGTLSRKSVGLGRLGWLNLIIQAVGLAASTVMQKKQIDKSVSLQKSALKADEAQRAADREAQVKVQLLEVNTERAKAGLPPVDITGKVIPGSALPTPQALTQLVPKGLTESTWIPGVPNYVTGGGALVALFLGLKAARVL